MVFSVIAGDTQIVILGEKNTSPGQLSKTEVMQKHFTYSAWAQKPLSGATSSVHHSGTRPGSSHLLLSLATGPRKPPPVIRTIWAYLAHGAVPAGLHVMLALIASVDEAVLALGVQLHQHAQCGPLGPPQGGELPVLVPGEGEEGITPIHEVTAEQGVGVNNGGQCIDDRPCMEVDHKEDLQKEQQE